MIVISRRQVMQTMPGMLLRPFASAHAADTLTLKAAAAVCGVRFGASPEMDLRTAPDAYLQLLASQCELLVPIVPWSAARQPGDYHFDGAAATLDFASAHHMQLTGSHLLWHEWMPEWFAAIATAAEAAQVMRQHITALMTRFAGRVYSWNVVNEAIRPEDGRVDGLRTTPLLRKIGPQYLEMAFVTARAADPRAILLYNDYGLETASPTHEARRTALLHVLDTLQRRGAPIDGVGLQSHLYPTATLDEPRYRRFLQNIAARGLKMIVTELDVLETETVGSVSVRDQIVADCYARFLSVALDERAVSALVIWGLADGFSWQNAPSRTQFRRPDGLPARPLPFDAEFRPKLALRAIRGALESAPKREPH
jgi:endo-1,4-beta-xylanase